ncbi:hypothetical protein [Actinopolymorpha cephalotaxi]|uniref:Uncharacterized protein n=1 Tax=Actinopolymorpha cephalotaxi TaxID=504797 RepID=A0ABX2S865_9ACTN|nr:hypothetical protein [Actinopolymorpha cephalotaxi]NYH85837.1 hypothetical protein [Actinopolymorpha cephalotaxi]
MSATGVVRSGWAVPFTQASTQASSHPGDPGPRPGGAPAGPAAGRTPDSSSSSTTSSAAPETSPPATEAADPRPLTEREWERLRRRAALLRDLAEAKDLFAVRANQLRRRRQALRRAL